MYTFTEQGNNRAFFPGWQPLRSDAQLGRRTGGAYLSVRQPDRSTKDVALPNGYRPLGVLRHQNSSMLQRTTPGLLSYPNSRRLLKPSQFQRVYTTGFRLHADACTLIFLPNDCDAGRLGISIHRRLKGSVQRNRIKRIIREFYRLAPHLDQRLVETCAELRKAAHGHGHNHPDAAAGKTALDLVVTVRPGYTLDSLGKFTLAMEKTLRQQARRRSHAQGTGKRHDGPKKK